MNNAENYRYSALDLAVSTCKGADYNHVLKVAALYYNFIIGVQDVLYEV